MAQGRAILGLKQGVDRSWDTEAECLSALAWPFLLPVDGKSQELSVVTFPLTLHLGLALQPRPPFL